MDSASYTIMLSTDESGAFRARIRELPEATAAGETAEDAIEQAQGAALRALMARMSSHRDIPAGQADAADGRSVRLPLLAGLKLALYREMRAQGVRKIDLARLLGWHPPQIDRLLDLTHGSRLEQIESGFRALGRTLAFSVAGDPPRSGTARTAPDAASGATNVGP
jgi:antitoxin HicB